jgi:hypothetical protein
MEAQKIKDQLEKISEEIRKKYQIEVYEGQEDVFIHEPTCINISYAKMFEVEEREESFWIENEKVLVTIWKKLKMMHVTIF